MAIIGTRGYPSYYGGFETLVRRLAPYLADHGWDVTVYGRPGTTTDEPRYHHHNIESINTRGLESRSLSTLTFGATSVLDAGRRRPDVALVMNVANGYWLPLLRSRGIPTVVNVDGVEWQRDKWSAAGKAVFKKGASLTAKFGDTLVCDSTNIAALWDKEFHRDSVFIPYGGDVAPGQLEVPAGLQRRKYALYVARFVPENTVAEFLRASQELAIRHRVVIVGSSGHGGPLEDEVRTMAKSMPNITWTGHIRDDKLLHSLWHNAGAYFHGHSVGGTNPALVQAMASGAPIIARDTVFNREVLSDTALFVKPRPQEIASSIGRLLLDTEQQTSLGIRAEARAAERYSWDTICKSYEETLRTAITTANPRNTHAPR